MATTEAVGMTLFLQCLIFLFFLFLVFFLGWLALNIIHKLYEPDVWMPGENIYVNPKTKEQHTFPSLCDTEATLYLSVIVPAYNETKRIPHMLDEALAYLEERRIADKAFTYEVIIVDDGSKDDTTDVALEYARNKDERIRVLTLTKNRGKGGAVRRGMLCARGKYLLMVDADGATQFSELMALETAITKCEKMGFGIAVGSREHLRRKANERRPFIRNLLMWGFHFFVVLCGVKDIKDTQCGFKLFSRRAAQLLMPNLNIERWAFDVELLFNAQRLGIPIAEVDVRWEEVAGSTLDPLSASIQMAKDIFRIKLLYTFRVWRLTQETVALHRTFSA